MNKLESSYLTSQLLRIAAGIELHDDLFMVTVPLYRPMYSLSQAIKDIVKKPQMVGFATIPFNSLPKTYNAWLPPHRLLPPFNATAIIQMHENCFHIIVGMVGG